MTRAQRNAHRLFWWVLAPLLIGTLAWAIHERWAFPETDPTEEVRR